MKKSVIIVAGGAGTRMNNAVPKQFLPLGGKPMLMHAVQAFLDAFPEITVILALPAGQFGTWPKLCHVHAFTAPHRLTPGGETRFRSVKNALVALEGDGLVAVHDGARPLVSPDLIRRVFETAERLGNCIPVVPVNESVRRISGEQSSPVDRDTLRVVQTPQVFSVPLLRKAYEQPFREDFTDDATVMESLGETIHLTEGERTNLKITHPGDLAVAEWLLKHPRG